MPDILTPDAPDTRRALEDRVLTLESIVSRLGDDHSELRTEMRREIASLRTELAAMSYDIRQVGSKIDRVIGGKAVITGLITLLTSILGSGVVHFAVVASR